jgi:hypothetical protein
MWPRMDMVVTESEYKLPTLTTCSRMAGLLINKVVSVMEEQCTLRREYVQVFRVHKNLNV